MRFFAKIIAGGSIIEQKSANSARKVPEYEGEHPYPIWPSRLNQNSQVRKEYIQALKSADTGSYEALISFMKRLGAADPTLVDLFKNNFYRTYIKGDKGSAIVKALLRNIGQEEALNSQPILRLAEKSGLENIMKLLLDFGLK